MAAVYILTVLYAVPDKLRESPLLFQMPPEKQEREWKDKDGAQKGTGELLPEAVPISPTTAEPVQLNSQAELVETRKSLDYFPAKNEKKTKQQKTEMEQWGELEFSSKNVWKAEVNVSQLKQEQHHSLKDLSQYLREEAGINYQSMTGQRDPKS